MFVPRGPESEIYVKYSSLGCKGLVEFMTQGFSHADRAIVTWEHFLEMFCAKYVPILERERLVHEYLLLKQTTESVTKITKIFTQRGLFFPEYVVSK